MVAIATSSAAWCASSQPADTLRGATLDSVMVEARVPLTRVSASVPVQSLGASDISALGLRDMAEAIRHFSGVSVKDYGGIGGLQTVSVRNMGASHTVVTLDGVALSNMQAGQIDVGQFAVDNVEALSISLGQPEGTLLSGRQYAAAAAFDIRTEKPRFEPTKTYLVRIKADGGPYGYVAPSLRWWQKMGGRTSLSVESRYLRADGNYPFTIVNGPRTERARRINSDVNQTYADVSLYHDFSQSTSLAAKAHFYYSERGLPGAVILYNPVSTERLYELNSFVQATLQRRQSDAGWSFQAQAKYSHGWSRYTMTGIQYEGGKQVEAVRQDEYYLSASACYSPTQWISATLAQDVSINTLTANFRECPLPRRLTSISALSLKLTPLSRLSVTATAVLTATDEHLSRPQSTASPKNYTRFDPSAAASYRILPDKPVFIRLMYEDKSRLPTFNDLYYLRLGNINLRPERARQWGGGIAWALSRPRGPLQALQLSADVYAGRVTDKIVAFPTTYVWKMQNFGRVHLTGADMAMTALLSLPLDMTLRIDGTYSLQRATDRTDRESRTWGAQLPYTPRHSGSASATLSTPWATLAYSLTAVGKRYYLAQNIPANRIDGYRDHTLTASRKFGFNHGMSLLLQVAVTNLTDAHYDVIKYYPMPGRTWRASATFIF